jgi:glyoxylase-like metal-dependent hydrolase (beta-lactamase superfamily II)
VSEDAFAPASEAGIHRLAIPTPFAVGRVNCYLIDDEPLTLVDAGPNSGRALDELQRALEVHGKAIEDLELVIVTHQHIDHIGLVEIVASRSGAEVAAIDAAVPFISDYSQRAAADDEFSGQIMLRHGISPDVVQALKSVSSAFRAWGAKVTVTRELHEGDTIELRDRTLEVHFRPGHSPSDTVFYDCGRRQLIAADHLIKHISSNPLITRGPDDEGDPGKRPQSLVMYLDSLRKTREMEIELVLPGHGDPIDDHRALIDERFKLHDRRAEKIYGLIAERPRSAYEIAQALWGNIAVTQAYLTLSEVLGHTDLLLNAGRVREEERDGVVTFEATA